jgi:cell division protein ZapE
MAHNLLQLYDKALSEGALESDVMQKDAIEKLHGILSSIVTPVTQRKFFRRVPSLRASGAYVYGPVGRGKTMMMDWCVKILKDSEKKVERWHFHQFMLALHASLSDVTAHASGLESRITHFADEMCARLDVLCFDEFHVTDVADAMIMMPLFERFFEKRLTLIVTGNWAPDDLYSGGLQRSRFLPFIDTLKRTMMIIHVLGEKDYRLVKQHAASGWLYPLNDESEELFTSMFNNVVGYDSIETHEIHVEDRTWTIPRASKNSACLNMDVLLNQPLGTADFYVLSKRYKTLFLDQLLAFSLDNNERAKRFMVMVDTLYEAECRFVVRSDVSIDHLYPNQGALAFEFERTKSRLIQMTKLV